MRSWLSRMVYLKPKTQFVNLVEAYLHVVVVEQYEREQVDAHGVHALGFQGRHEPLADGAAGKRLALHHQSRACKSKPGFSTKKNTEGAFQRRVLEELN